MTQPLAQHPSSQQQARKDWLIDSKNRSVQHSSGLVIQLGDKNAAHKLAALDIRGLEKLSGTPWATRSNLLIETGIALLAAL